jgi:serine/threonine protein kinase
VRIGGDEVDDIDADTLRELARERVGRQLDGIGELEQLVGVGGMAAVYRVCNEQGDPVAVKLMHEHLSENTSLRERFLREATILDQVDHPNSVQVYGTGELASGEAYFVMELLEGIEVGTVWKRKETFPTGGALRIIVQVLDCLDAYHEAGVLHRDLKPGNLFLTEEGLVKLIDFGLARFRVEGRATTKKGTALGTPAYMAPEQALGKQEQVDERTDIFGVGATLFALLAGQPLFDIGTADAALVQAATSRPDSLADHAPHLPDAVIEFVDRSISWERGDRYQSAAEMRQAARDLLESEELERDTDVASPEPAGENDDDQAQKVGWVGVMQDFFSDIATILETLSRAPDDDTSRQNLKNAFNKIRLAAGRRDEPITWEVLPHSFEMNGQVVWEPDGPFEEVPHTLFDSGIRTLTVRDSLRFGEFVAFVQWLSHDLGEPLPEEDNPATRFRNMGLSSIDAEIVDVFTWTATDDLPDPGRHYREVAERAVDYLHDSDGMWDGLENLVDAEAAGDVESRGASVSNKIDRLATEFLRSPKGILSKTDASQLYRQIRKQREDWDDWLGPVLADIWQHTHDSEMEPTSAPAELVDYYLEDDRVEPLVRILADAQQRLEGEARREFLERALPADRLDDILTTILQAASVAPPEVHRQLVDALTDLVAGLPSSYNETVERLYHDGGELLREVLEGYLDGLGARDETVEMQGFDPGGSSDLRE